MIFSVNIAGSVTTPSLATATQDDDSDDRIQNNVFFVVFCLLIAVIIILVLAIVGIVCRRNTGSPNMDASMYRPGINQPHANACFDEKI